LLICINLCGFKGCVKRFSEKIFHFCVLPGILGEYASLARGEYEVKRTAATVAYVAKLQGF